MTADEKNLIERWIVELRSGNYIQGRGLLVQKSSRDDGKGKEYNTYCCLGVLAHIVDPLSDAASPNTGMGHLSLVVIKKIRERLEEEGLQYIVTKGDMYPRSRLDNGLPRENCITMNDSIKFTFEQIADILESELEADRALQPA